MSSLVEQIQFIRTAARTMSIEELTLEFRARFLDTGSRYTSEQLDFLREGYKTMLVPELTRAFNKRFGKDKEPGQIRSTLKNHGIKCGRECNKQAWRSKLFTPAQDLWLRDNYPLLSLVDLTVAFNAQFAAVKTSDQIKTFLGNNDILSGRTGCFEKGLIPWNQGKKGYIGPNRTSFTPGQIPGNKVRLWSVRINRDGYVEISVPETNPWTGAATRFKHLHLWLWEHLNGPLPKGYAVIFVDGNNRNFSPDNLLKVTRKELLTLNLHRYKDQPAEVKPSILALARLEAKAGFRSTGRPGGGRKRKDVPTAA